MHRLDASVIQPQTRLSSKAAMAPSEEDMAVSIMVVGAIDTCPVDPLLPIRYIVCRHRF